MHHEEIHLNGKTGDGYVIPLKTCNLVFIKTPDGLLACGAIDVAALDTFNIPAARISGVATLDDLLNGTVREANQHAAARGVQPGMSGRDALEKL